MIEFGHRFPSSFYIFLRRTFRLLFYSTRTFVVRILGYLNRIDHISHRINDPQRVIAINQQAIGDLTLSLEAFRDLIKWRENDTSRHLLFIIKPEYESWVKNRLKFDNVIGVTRNEILRKSNISKIKLWNPDTLVDLDPSARLTGMRLSRKLRLNRVYGTKTAGKEAWANKVVNVDISSQSNRSMELNYKLITNLVTRDSQEKYFIKSIEKPINRKWHVPLKLAIHPGAGIPERQWPVTQFAKLCRLLALNRSVEIGLFGGYQDSLIVQQLSTLLKDLSPKKFVNSPLKIFTEKLSGYDLLLCNNSGPLHIARELGIRTVSISGPSSSVWDPPESEDHLVLRADLPCSGCEDIFSCRIDIACLNRFNAEEVWPQVLSFINLVEER